jgi:hypothetical protein
MVNATASKGKSMVDSTGYFFNIIPYSFHPSYPQKARPSDIGNRVYPSTLFFPLKYLSSSEELVVPRFTTENDRLKCYPHSRVFRLSLLEAIQPTV